MINDKLKSLVKSLNFSKSERKPNSPLNSSQYNPTEALDNLQIALNGGNKQITPIKSARTESVTKDDYIVQRDPYNSVHKVQFEEAVRADGIVQRALHRKADFVFAKGVKTVLDTMDDDYKDFKEKEEATQSVINKPEYTKVKQLIDKINRKVNLRNNLRIGYFNCKTYGRSALLIEEGYDPNKPSTKVKSAIDTEYIPDASYPSSLYPLNSKLLGNVYCEKKHNGLAYVEYNSNEATDYNNKIFYEPKDMIYFTNFDYHISPNTLYYGLSEIEAVKDISETNRVLDEEDFKEWARSLWAGIILFTMPNLQNSTEVENLLSNYNPGKPVAITADIKAEMLKIADGLGDGIELHIQNDRRIARAIGVPSMVLGWEDVTNRATTQFILHAWKESFIEQERIWLKDIVQKQWINPLMSKAMNIDIEEVEDLDVKITLEFVEYNFDTFSQNVDAWLPLAQAGYISVERFLEEIGKPELAEEYKKVKKELVTQGFVPNMGQSNPAFGGPKGFGRKPGVPNDETENQGGRGGGDGSESSAEL